jgi:hypothetical protein
LPCESVTRATISGFISLPPLAIALIAVASCRLLMLMPCPNAMVAASTSYQRL